VLIIVVINNVTLINVLAFEVATLTCTGIITQD